MALTEGLVFEFDSIAKLDEAEAIDRSWTSGWQKFEETGWLHGFTLLAKKDHKVQVIVDVAIDLAQDFIRPQRFRLIGGKANDKKVKINYRLWPPILAAAANVRIRIQHLYDSAESEISNMGFEVQNLIPTDEKLTRGQDKQ